MKITVQPSSGENTKVFGSLEDAVEYCKARLHENFVIFDADGGRLSNIISRSQEQLINALSNVQIR